MFVHTHAIPDIAMGGGDQQEKLVEKYIFSCPLKVSHLETSQGWDEGENERVHPLIRGSWKTGSAPYAGLTTNSTLEKRNPALLNQSRIMELFPNDKRFLGTLKAEGIKGRFSAKNIS